MHITAYMCTLFTVLGPCDDVCRSHVYCLLTESMDSWSQPGQLSVLGIKGPVLIATSFLQIALLTSGRYTVSAAHFMAASSRFFPHVSQTSGLHYYTILFPIEGAEAQGASVLLQTLQRQKGLLYSDLWQRHQSDPVNIAAIKKKVADVNVFSYWLIPHQNMYWSTLHWPCTNTSHL